MRLTGMELGFLASAANPAGHAGGANLTMRALERKGLVTYEAKKAPPGWYATASGLAELARRPK